MDSDTNTSTYTRDSTAGNSHSFLRCYVTLVVTKRLYKGVCPSVRHSVHSTIRNCFAVRPCIRPCLHFHTMISIFRSELAQYYSQLLLFWFSMGLTGPCLTTLYFLHYMHSPYILLIIRWYFAHDFQHLTLFGCKIFQHISASSFHVLK